MQGMGDFLNEMAVMMSQTKPDENEEQSFGELQELFEEMFQDDIDASFGGGAATFQPRTSCSTSSSSSSSSSRYMPYGESTLNSNNNKKHDSCKLNSGKSRLEDSSGFGFNNHQFQKFCLGVERQLDFKKAKGVGVAVRGGIQVGAAGRGRRRQHHYRRN